MTGTPTQAGAFTYSGSTGLLYNGERRCTQAQLQERLSKPATLNVKFLKAQLAHYAITPLSGTKLELEAKVRNAVAEGRMRLQPKGMKEMEKGLKESWEREVETGYVGGSTNGDDASAGVNAYLRFGDNTGPAQSPVNTAPSPVKKDPSQDERSRWATGGNPMTERQAGFLRALCQHHNVYFNPSLTKAEASRQISELKDMKDMAQQQPVEEDADGMDMSW